MSAKNEYEAAVNDLLSFCDNHWEECSAGIHFFITRKEAERY